MKFSDFLESDKVLDEAAMTLHGKVESTLRELGLNYKIESVDYGKIFYLDKNFILVSYNNGGIDITKRAIRGFLGCIKTVGNKDIRGSLQELLKDIAKELFSSTSKESETV